MRVHGSNSQHVQSIPVPPAGLPYLAGLDGLRAIAVLAVLIYHADLPLAGGFLGVESFFVISGFLITALLLADWEAYGRVRLRSFWWRRARRLLPALFALLAGVGLATAILLPTELNEFAGEALAALGYLTNWQLIAAGQPYFDPVERPSLLRHLWSLAVEEQFYIVWPLLFGLGMRFAGRRGLLALTLLAAAGSSALAWFLATPGADPARVYYGTDTRAAGLLLGCALAFVYRGRQYGRSMLRSNAVYGRLGVAIDATGLLALLALLAAYGFLGETHPLLYRGGIGAVALITLALVAATTHPAARLLPRLLELAPLRWVGLRSYSLYLWHWPVFMLTRPGFDLPSDGWPLQLVRFGLAFGLAILSYRFVELPIRQGALERAWAKLRQRPIPAWPSWRYPTWASFAALLGFSLAMSYIGSSIAHAAVRQNFSEIQAVAPVQTVAAAPARPTAAAPANTILTITNPRDEAVQFVARPAPAVTRVVITGDSGPPAFDPALAARLQAILDETVADGEIPGVVLSVRLPNGRSWQGASGIADREAGVPMEAETRVRIGSLSKMFTAVVVLQLVEEGRLELDAPVDRWLPGLLPNGETITVRRLLQHTSGLYDYLADRRFVAEAYASPERAWAPEELVAYATGFPPAFAPGEPDAWSYSNTNFVVLGMLVEQVTGNSLSAELEQRIFAPLDLNQTAAIPPDSPDGLQARGYSGDDSRAEVSLSFAFGTANIVSTAGDLRRFGEALFGDELLGPASRAEMRRFVNGKGAYNMPELEYGLGLMANRFPIGPAPGGQERPTEQIRVLGHIGGINGFRSALWYAPEYDILIALSVNQGATDPNELATKLLELLLAAEGL